MMKQTLEVALVQSPLVWENPERNRNHFSNLLYKIGNEVDLVVLPEMFTTGFTMTPQHIDVSEGQKTIEWMIDEARNLNAALAGSIPFFENEQYTNRLFFVEPNGKYTHYDKRHTFTLAGEDKVYKAGKNKLIIEYKGFKICPMICYDLRFPVWSRNVERYDVLIYVANWPTPRIAAWDTLLKARAIENMAYCIGVNRCGSDKEGHIYSGHSAVFDSLGTRLVFSEEETVLYACLQKDQISKARTKLRFLEDQDNFTLKS